MHRAESHRKSLVRHTVNKNSLHDSFSSLNYSSSYLPETPFEADKQF